MDKSFGLRGITKALAIVFIIVHCMFFILETICWMQPFVYTILLKFLDNPVDLPYAVQAQTLKKLFINQGFYNLFLAAGGWQGVYFVRKRKFAAGYTLLLFTCFAGIGAGIVLACSTKAYVLALLQCAPAAICFVRIYPLYKKVSATSQNSTSTI